MLRIVCLLSCLGAVLGGGLGIGEPLLDYPVAARSSVAYGNAAFLARYGVVTPGLASSPFIAAHTAAIQAAPITPVVAARTLAAAPIAPVVAARTVAAAPLAATTYVQQPLAHVAAAPLITPAATYSSLHHVPAVAQVPVTKYEAHPAVVQNVVDVAHPKVATKKFEIRRPAIQKEFYDIEERVVVRPAGSAVVELDQPVSKSQRGPTVVSPALAAARVQPFVATAAAVRALPVAHHTLAHHTLAHHTLAHTQAFLPAVPALTVPVQSYPIQGPSLQQPIPAPAQPVAAQPTPRPDLADQTQFDDSDSVSVENPEISRARIAQQPQPQLQQQPQQDQLQNTGEIRLQLQRLLEQQFRSQAEQRIEQQFQTRARQQAQQQLIEHQQLIERQQQSQQRPLARQQTPAPVRENDEVSPRLSEIRRDDITREFTRTSQQQTQEIPSFRNSPDVELSNQARYISLLTERGPVSELRSDRGNLDGRIRARILSATPAPYNAEARDEQVNTRRVVVNRPIHTVQEVDVVEPFTKIERIAVNQPAVVKTARVGVANVATSFPVHTTYTHPHYVL